MDHIDDFYDAELRGLGFNVVYGRRGVVASNGSEHHTVAIAYNYHEWVLIDKEEVDLAEVKRWFDGPTADQYATGPNLNALLCIL